MATHCPVISGLKMRKRIPGEMVNELRVDKVTMATDGTYKCIVQNEENLVKSNEVTVRVMRGKESKKRNARTI